MGGKERTCVFTQGTHPWALSFTITSSLILSVAEGSRWPLLDSVNPVHIFYSPKLAVTLSSAYLGL